jgi:hypothetical protein
VVDQVRDPGPHNLSVVDRLRRPITSGSCSSCVIAPRVRSRVAAATGRLLFRTCELVPGADADDVPDSRYPTRFVSTPHINLSAHKSAG